MFSVIGLIIIAILTGGSLVALLFVRSLTTDLLTVLPFVVFAGCVAFVLMIAGNILKTILSIPGRNRQEEQQERVVYVEPRKVKKESGSTKKISATTRQKQLDSGGGKRKQVKKNKK